MEDGSSETDAGTRRASMSRDEILAEANRIVEPFGLTAEFLGDAHSVGVGGDARTYTPVIVLVGPFPGYDVLEKIGSRIWNELNINRVTFETARRESLPEGA